MRENRLYGSVGGWGLIAPRLPNLWTPAFQVGHDCSIR
jgi:hypothetical protein